jgi:hypothetical protein
MARTRTPGGGPPRRRSTRAVGRVGLGLLGAGVLPGLTVTAARAADGQGFTLHSSDLRSIENQIRISERHAATPDDPNAIQVLDGTGTAVVREIPDIPANAVTSLVTGLAHGTSYTFRVAAVNRFGAGPLSQLSNAVTPLLLTAPGVPTTVQATPGVRSPDVAWAPPALRGGTPILRYELQVRRYVFNLFPVAIEPATTVGPTATSAVITGLANGARYDVRVRAVNAVVNGPYSAFTQGCHPARRPEHAGDSHCGVGYCRWDGHRDRQMGRSGQRQVGTVAATTTWPFQRAGVRSLTMTPRAGDYRFTVQAVNAVGASSRSARSAQVIARPAVAPARPRRPAPARPPRGAAPRARRPGRRTGRW